MGEVAQLILTLLNVFTNLSKKENYKTSSA